MTMTDCLSVQQFLEDYQDDLNVLRDEAKSIFMECYDCIDKKTIHWTISGQLRKKSKL